MERGQQQIAKWAGDFGRKYTLRNTHSVAELDRVYKKIYEGKVTFQGLNKDFLGDLPKDIRILEVGSNVGNQLLGLQAMGFRNLYGIDVNPFAVEGARKRLKGVNVIQGSALDIPFKDGFFDLVFTATVLIHMAPDNLPLAMKEVVRCSREYVWGYEYYAAEFQEVSYRGNAELMWKGDYAGIYQKKFRGLKLVKQQFLKYRDNDNIDAMFLLKKG